MSRLEKELLTKYGEIRKDQLIRGMKQVGDFWREEDGDAAAFEDFVRGNFAGDEKVRDAIFTRFQSLLEKIDGSMHEIDIALDRQTDLNLGPIYPFDRVFASYGVSAHIMDDFFTNKLAFVVLLNFPQTTLEQRLNEGEKWTRRQWAEARLVQRFSKRIPASVNLALARAGSASDQYIADYNIWMYHLLDNDGERLFPPRLRLLSHWNLRDELKANYENSKNGLAKQRMIIKVMERIVDQTIPAVVINNPHVDWNPYTNKLTAAAVSDSDEDPAADMRISDDPEPDTRYRIWLDDFLASRMVDEYSPTAPTLIERRFNEDREIPEERVREMFEQVCGSPLAARVAQVIRKRLGRDLEPLDLWYNGFRSTGKYTEAELDKIVSEKYPTPRAYKDDMPRFLRLLGFPGEKADQIAGNILVEAARGSGHASGGEMRGQPARLRTRVNRDGMDYKGFNIAVHEMGHNVEQTISMNFIDHTLLGGVPNTAFTEAFAFVFQENDLMLLGLDPQEDEQSEALKALNDFWMTMEISAVSLVDMEAWHWLYDHPQATAAQFKKALIKIAKDVWNRYYASLLGKKDVYLLGIYSHMIHSFLYLPDYPIGHLISVQVREQMQKAGNIGVEFERMALQGNIAPDLWMKGATGSPVGAEAMLEATEKALWVLE
ncbi:MAG: hypothetical protein JXB45_01385 [Candidatus Krumholzibacteriota bacterium]|nr:hypothetical protein [Candidatus Krumholzibacteriota bacterium]